MRKISYRTFYYLKPNIMKYSEKAFLWLRASAGLHSDLEKKIFKNKCLTKLQTSKKELKNILRYREYAPNLLNSLHLLYGQVLRSSF
jgi:hypothetical protein